MNNGRTRNSGLSRLYRRVIRLHSAAPFHFVPSGHAFPPWHYFFEVTRRCNLRCRMCQYKDWFDRHAAGDLIDEELTTREWIDLIDQTGRFSLITFTGGEPWVRSDFLELLEHASRKRRTHFITNGLLVTEERAARCVELAPKRISGKGLCFVGVSIDGTREVHDAIRGREGAFDESLEAIRLLSRYRREQGKGCPLIHVTAVIQNDNLDALPALPAILSEAGADALNLTMEIRFPGLEGLGETDPEAFCAFAEDLPTINPLRLEKALVRTRDACTEAGLELRLPNMPQREIIRYHNGGLNLDHFTCREVWTNLYVGAAGDVYPCFIYKVGNVREHSMRSLWNSPQMRAFRKRLKEAPFCICQGCCHLEYVGRRDIPRAPAAGVQDRAGNRDADA